MRNRLIAKFIGISIAFLIPALARAQVITYDFTGTVTSGALIGETLTGYQIVNLAALAIVDTSATQTEVASSDPSAGSGSITFQNGVSIATNAAPASTNTGVGIYRGTGNEYFIQTGSFVLSGPEIDILTANSSTIFSTPSNNVSVNQSVNWLTPGSTNLGEFQLTNAFDYGQFTINSITAVPEPSALALMLAGFGPLAFLARRRALRQPTCPDLRS